MDNTDALFTERFAKSRVLAKAADAVLAGGVCHDSWRLTPFPVGFVGASGAWKTDLEGRRMVDYWMGHGALMLGHAPPAVVAEVRRQVSAGTQLAGLLPQQVDWAELVCTMVPGAERIRFTASGTEATLLAARIARAYTGRPKIIKIDGHFHGWHDEALCHYVPALDSGLDERSENNVALAPHSDIAAVEQILGFDDVAGIILEPGGGSSSSLPYDPEYLAELRRCTDATGALLIFDEVISGFRFAPGGVQELSGVIPDLTVLAKILCGGLPGGAVAGRKAVMGVFKSSSDVGERGPIVHSGTFNGNPLSAAAGLATLRTLVEGSAQRQVARSASKLAQAVNDLGARKQLDVQILAHSSILHILIGARRMEVPVAPGVEAVQLMHRFAAEHDTLRKLLLVEGVDIHPTHGWLSMAHTDNVLEQTLSGFEHAFDRIRGDRGIACRFADG